MEKSDYEALAAFRYALRKFMRFSEQAAQEHGLTPQQYQALLAIEGFPGRDHLTVGELAEQLQVAAHSAVGLVDRLEEARYVARTKAGDDRRRVHIRLTRQGRQRLEKLAGVHRQELRSVGPLLASLLEKAFRP